jgi:hypothetical protein
VSENHLEERETLTRLLQGAAAGAVATMIIGFQLGRMDAREYRRETGQGCRTGKYRAGIGTHLRR